MAMMKDGVHMMDTMQTADCHACGNPTKVSAYSSAAAFCADCARMYMFLDGLERILKPLIDAINRVK